jgi:TPR repeat protein
MSYLDHLHNGLLSVMGRPATQLARASELAAQGSHRAAYPLFVKAAKAGLPAAAGELGRAYLFGHGVPRCLTEALRWLTWAASAGEVAAQTLLADLALQGISRTTTTGFFDAVSEHTKDMPDYDQALKWARRAALGGSSEAKALLGFILTAGPAQVRDQEQGEDFYQQAAETGNPFGQLGWALILLRRNTAVAVGKARGLLEAAASAGLATAHYMLGIIAESGVAGAQDFLVAAEHYRAGAELGHHSAELRYGIALLLGRGVKQDAFNGESWLRRAGLAGEPQAAAMVGDLYTRAGFLPPNYVEAAIWFRRAAEAGHTGSARKLGQLHLSGAGVVRDPEEAALWFRKAAARGNADAMVDLAQLALTRQIPGADRQTILAWFQQKAETGDLAAIFNLGICLAEGIGTRRDDPQALALFRRAAKCMPIAQYWYGRMLAEGRGTAPDLQSARTWFLKAAEQHNADAEAAAGEMLFNGRGGPPDRSMAMALFMRAAAAGQPGAVFALEVLRRSEPNGASGGQCLAA